MFDLLTSVVLSFPIGPVKFVACLCAHTLAQGFETQQTLSAVERFFHAVIFQDLIYKTEKGAVYKVSVTVKLNQGQVQWVTGLWLIQTGCWNPPCLCLPLSSYIRSGLGFEFL